MILAKQSDAPRADCEFGRQGITAIRAAKQPAALRRGPCCILPDHGARSSIVAVKAVVACLLLMVASLCLAGCVTMPKAPATADHSFMENQAQRGSFD